METAQPQSRAASPSCPSDDTFSRWLDGALPAAELAEFDAHLRDCEACRATARELRPTASQTLPTPSRTLLSPSEPPAPEATLVESRPTPAARQSRPSRAPIAPRAKLPVSKEPPRPFHDAVRERLRIARLAVAVVALFLVAGGVFGWLLRFLR